MSNDELAGDPCSDERVLPLSMSAVQRGAGLGLGYWASTTGQSGRSPAIPVPVDRRLCPLLAMVPGTDGCTDVCAERGIQE